MSKEPSIRNKIDIFMLHNSLSVPSYQDLDDHIIWHVGIAMVIILTYYQHKLRASYKLLLI